MPNIKLRNAEKNYLRLNFDSIDIFKDMDLDVLLLELRSSNFGYRSIRRPSFHYAFQIQPISFDSRVGSADFRL